MEYIEGEALREQITRGKLQVENLIDVKAEHLLL